MSLNLPRRSTAVGLAILVTLFTALGCGQANRDDHGSFFFVDHLRQAEVEVTGPRTHPAARPQQLRDRFTFGYETRRALTPPLSTRVVFPVHIPKDAVLRFALAASTMGRPTLLAPVEFRVRIEVGAGSQMVFEETLPRSRPNRWLPREVDLSSWAGSKVRLSFETERGAGGVPKAERSILPLWANPVVARRAPVASTSMILLISVDCLRADHVGRYGYGRDTTPGIDAFSREAVLFRSAVSTSSYTLPTHASMLTGLPPGIHRAERVGIPPSVPYIPRLLAEAGYRVSGVVSAPFLSPAYGFDRGFHTYSDMVVRADQLVDKALTMLREGYGQDQFLFLHLMDAHWTYAPPKKFLTRFAERPRDISRLLHLVGNATRPTDSELDQIISLYDGEISYIDHELGRLFDELKKMDLYDRALIILTADHGEAFLEHGYWEHARPWRTDGPGLYEEILHVPLLVKWPGATSAMESPSVVSQMDIFPTIVEAAGLKTPQIWARSLRRYADGGAPPAPSPRVMAHFTSRSTEKGAAMQIALRAGHEKYIASFRSDRAEDLLSAPVQKEELYDLRDDPHEKKNLLMQPGRDAEPFRAALDRYLEQVREAASLSRDQEIVLDEATLEKLRTLGYIER